MLAASLFPRVDLSRSATRWLEIRLYRYLYRVYMRSLKDINDRKRATGDSLERDDLQDISFAHAKTNPENCASVVELAGCIGSAFEGIPRLFRFKGDLDLEICSYIYRVRFEEGRWITPKELASVYPHFFPHLVFFVDYVKVLWRRVERRVKMEAGERVFERVAWDLGD